MKLIASLTSPYARKVRMVLLERNIPCQLEIDMPWQEQTVTPRYNPLGKVPVLVLDDGSSVYDSRVICEYLDHVATTALLIPQAARSAVKVKQIEALADGTTDAAVAIFLERSRRTPACQDSAWVDRQFGKLDRGLTALANYLDDRQWLFEDQLSLADLAAAACLGYLDLRIGELDWRASHPRLAAYHQRISERASFQQTVPPAQ